MFPAPSSAIALGAWSWPPALPGEPIVRDGCPVSRANSPIREGRWSGPKGLPPPPTGTAAGAPRVEREGVAAAAEGHRGRIGQDRRPWRGRAPRGDERAVGAEDLHAPVD